MLSISPRWDDYVLDASEEHFFSSFVNKEYGGSTISFVVVVSRSFEKSSELASHSDGIKVLGK